MASAAPVREMSNDDSLEEEYKYARTGYVDQGRKSDILLASFLEQLPGDGKLPLRWFHRSVEAFQKSYSHLGVVLWAPASSSHLLLVAGQKIIRVWHDSERHCLVDLNEPLANYLSSRGFSVEAIPAGNIRKCKPMTRRVRVTQKFMCVEIIKAVKALYGLDQPRLSVRLWT